MRSLAIFTVSGLVAILSGCATSEVALPSDLSLSPTPEEIASSPSGKCPLTIYRNKTSFKAISFDFDLPVAYINDVAVGRLRVGNSHCANIKPGRYFVVVKEPNIFGPVVKAKAVIEIKEGQSSYLRYAMNFGSLAVTGTAVSMNTQDSLQLVTEQDWLARR